MHSTYKIDNLYATFHFAIAWNFKCLCEIRTQYAYLILSLIVLLLACVSFENIYYNMIILLVYYFIILLLYYHHNKMLSVFRFNWYVLCFLLFYYFIIVSFYYFINLLQLY